MIKVQLQDRYTTKEPDPAITGSALGKVLCRFAPRYHLTILEGGGGLANM